MFHIQNIDENTYKEAYNFLKTIPSISNIDDSILKNGVIVLEEEKVIGSISFEIYDHVGLVRYFVFKRNLANGILNHLLESLEQNAKKLGINCLICVADNSQIEDLFGELGFVKLEKKVFINEDKISATNFSSSNFLFKNI